MQEQNYHSVARIAAFIFLLLCFVTILSRGPEPKSVAKEAFHRVDILTKYPVPRNCPYPKKEYKHFAQYRQAHYSGWLSVMEKLWLTQDGTINTTFVTYCEQPEASTKGFYAGQDVASHAVDYVNRLIESGRLRIEDVETLNRLLTEAVVIHGVEALGESGESGS